jgi:hypothetical protein
VTFKVDAVAAESRRGREDTVILLRKQKKGDQLAKRRMGGGGGSNNPANNNVESTIREVVTLFQSRTSTAEQQLEATVKIRKLLSVDKPPAKQVVRAGLIPVFVQLLTAECPNQVFQAEWALTNLASSECTKDVAESGAVPHLAKLLQHPAAEVREQAAWCLGNVAGHSCQYRDALMNTDGVIEGYLANLVKPDNSQLLHTFSWAISNLCRGKNPYPDMEKVKQFIRPLVETLEKIEESDSDKKSTLDLTVIEICWALSYLNDGENARIQAVYELGAIPPLMEIVARYKDCNKDKRCFIIPSIRAVGNFVTGVEHHADAVIDAGFFDHIWALLNFPSNNVVKDICWIISNFAAGSLAQIDKLFTCGVQTGELKKGELMKKVVNLALHGSLEIRKEALWAICNVISTGTDKHLLKLVQYEVIGVLSEALKLTQESRLVVAVIDAFEVILSISKKESRNYEYSMEEAGGLQNIEALQQHANDAVYQKAIALIDTYLSGEEDNEDENLAPTDDGVEFNFGMPTKQLFPVDDISNSFNFGGSITGNS